MLHRQRRIDLLVAMGVGAMAFVPYAGVVSHQFVGLDTATYVTENPWLQPGLTPAGIQQAFRLDGYAANWHPLTWLSHLIDIELHGLDWPGGHKLTSVMLHVVNTMLLFGVLLRMTRWGASQRGVGALEGTTPQMGLWMCTVVAAWFGVHPLRVESVVWVAERKDVLSGLFFMLTLWTYTAFAVRPSVGRYVLVMAMLAGGLMSKPMLVTVPAVLLLLDWWPLGRVWQGTDRKKQAAWLVGEKVPLIVLSAASAAVTVYAQRAGGAIKTLQSVGPGDRLANALVSYGVYLWQTLWPVGLTCFYPFPGTGLWTRTEYWPYLAAGSVLLAGISILAYRARRERPYLGMGWLWYLGMLVPVIGLVTVGDQAHADRYTYLPSIGIYLAVVWCVGELAAARPGVQKFAVIAGILVAAVWMGLTWRQVGVWRSNRALYAHAVEVEPESAMGWSGLGLELCLAGELDKALAHCRRGVELRSDEYTRQCLAFALESMGRYADAADEYERVIDWDPTNAKAYAALARLRARESRFDAALKLINRALELQPGVFEFRSMSAELLGYLGRHEEARSAYADLQRRWPKRAEAYAGLGGIERLAGNWPQAVEQFRRAVELAPREGAYRQALVEAYLAAGDAMEAKEAAEQYARLFPDSAEAPWLLGMLLTATGDSRGAIGAYRAALALRPDLHEAANNLAWILATSTDERLRNGAEAARLARRVCEATSYENEQALDTLAVALAETGEFGEAVEVMQRAIAQAAQRGAPAEFVGELESHKALFEAGRPYRAAR